MPKGIYCNPSVDAERVQDLADEHHAIICKFKTDAQINLGDCTCINT